MFVILLFQQLQEDFDELNEDYKRCLVEQKQTQSELERARERLQQERAEFSEKLLGLQHQKRELLEQREILEKRCVQLEKEGRTESVEGEFLDPQREQLRRLQETLENQRTDLERRERVLSEQSERHQAALREQKRAWAERIAEFESQRQDIRHQRQLLLEKEARLQEELSREREVLRKTRDSEKQHIDMLRGQLLEKQELLKGREELLKKKAEEMQKEYEERIQDQCLLKTGTQDVLLDLKQQLQRAEEEENRLRNQLQQQVDEHEVMVVRLQDEIRERVRMAEEKSAMVEKLDEQLRDLKVKHQSEQERQGREISGLVTALEKAQEENRDSVRELEHVQQDHRHQAELVTELLGKVDEYTKTNRAAEKEIERIREQLAMKTEETNVHRQQLHELNDRYNTMNIERELERENQKKQLYALEQEMKELSDAKAAVQTELQSAVRLCTSLVRALPVSEHKTVSEYTTVESFESLEAALRGLQRGLHAIESRLQENEEELRTMGTIITDQQGALLMAQSEAQAHAEELREEKRRAEDQEQANFELRLDVERRQGREAELIQEVNELNKALKLEQQRYREAKDLNERLQKKRQSSPTEQELRAQLVQQRHELEDQRTFIEQHMMLIEECSVLRQKQAQIWCTYQTATCFPQEKTPEQDQEPGVHAGVARLEVLGQEPEPRRKLSVCSEGGVCPRSRNHSDLLIDRIAKEQQSWRSAAAACRKILKGGENPENKVEAIPLISPTLAGDATENLENVCGHCLLRKAKALVSGASHGGCYCLTSSCASKVKDFCTPTVDANAAQSTAVGNFVRMRGFESWAYVAADAVEGPGALDEADDAPKRDAGKGQGMKMLWFIE